MYGLLVLVVVFYGYYNAIKKSALLEQVNLENTYKTEDKYPNSVRIPAINVDTKIEHLGIDKQGAVGSTESPNTVAWYTESPIPGENGNSILSGHSGWKDNIPAVFDDLHKLDIGDKIYVTENSGRINVFVIRSIKVYVPGDDTTAIFGIGDGKPHLHLITCSGIWNSETGRSPDRLIIFADKETN